MTGFVKYQTPKEVSEKIIEAISVAKATGKVTKGVNETTKAVERGICKFAVMAEDVTPPEILMHIPVICDEKKVAFGYKRKDKPFKIYEIDIDPNAGRMKPGSLRQITFGSKEEVKTIELYGKQGCGIERGFDDAQGSRAQ